MFGRRGAAARICFVGPAARWKSEGGHFRSLRDVQLLVGRAVVFGAAVRICFVGALWKPEGGQFRSCGMFNRWWVAPSSSGRRRGFVLWGRRRGGSRRAGTSGRCGVQPRVGRAVVFGAAMRICGAGGAPWKPEGRHFRSLRDVQPRVGRAVVFGHGRGSLKG
ncbi:MAG: hypothetical protein ACKV2U_23435 [Bryobacteraceae bacterium]